MKKVKFDAPKVYICIYHECKKKVFGMDPHEHLETINFHDEEHFLEQAGQPQHGLYGENLMLFMNMVYQMKDAVFEDRLYEPDMEKMNQARGVFRWHLMRNFRFIWEFLINHKVMYPGQQQPFDAVLSLRIETERVRDTNQQVRVRMVAEDNLNYNETGNFKLFFDPQRVLSPSDIFPLFEIWLGIERNGKTINEIKEIFMDEAGKYEFRKKYQSEFPKFLLKNKPVEQEGTSVIKEGHPWITELPRELLRMIYYNGPTDLRSQEVYNFQT